MPAIGAPGNFRPQAPLPKPKPKPPPPRSYIPPAGAVMRGIASVAPPPPPTPEQAVVAAATRGLQRVGATGSRGVRAAYVGGTVGAARVAALGKSVVDAVDGRYARALIATFNHQSDSQKHALVQSMLARPLSPESVVLLNYLHSPAGVDAAIHAGGLVPDNGGVHVLRDLANLISIPHVGPQSRSNTQQLAASVGVPTGGKVLGNALKDVVNLPAEAGPSISIPVGQALSGDPIGALNTFFVKPVEQFANDPSQILKHPVDAALIAMGIGHGVTRLGEAGLRGVRGTPPPVLHPEPVHLTGNMTDEFAANSKYPITRAVQESIHIAKNRRATEAGIDNPAGALVPRSEITRGLRIRHMVSQRIGMDERLRRHYRLSEMHAHARLVLPNAVDRLVHGIKTAARYNPAPALIPGAEVLARIADHTLRTPETARADLKAHIEKTAALRHELVDQPAIKEHDAYIKALRAAYDNPRLRNPSDWARAFAAADAHAPAYRSIENAVLNETDHYGTMDQEALLRRALQPVIESHMPGAFYSPVFGMSEEVSEHDVHPQIRALQKQASKLAAQLEKYGPKESEAADFGKGTDFGAGARRSIRERLADIHTKIEALRERPSRPLSTKEMADFDRRMTGKTRPLPSYTSHQQPRGDSAFYVNQQKFPRQAVQGNTMFAYRHGLTEPSHDALLEARVHLRGVLDAHRAMNRLLKLITVGRVEGKSWRTYADANRDAPPGYRPIWVGRMNRAAAISPSDPMNALAIEQEAARHALSISDRLAPSSAEGHWNLIHNAAESQLKQHEWLISPPALLRAARGVTGQFRRVALGTSFRHIPGIAQELLIRDAANGVFFQHWLAERNVHREAVKIDPELAERRRVELGGGTLSGATRALQTRQTSRQLAGSQLERPMRAVEKFMRAPVARHLATAWDAWLKFTLDGTRRFLEEQHQRAGIGKQLLRDFGGLMRLQGDAAHYAALHGYLPEPMMRRLRAGTERMYGDWLDKTPGAQIALMASPFGMWWVNSAKWLMRLPIDHPITTAVLADANVGTEKQRQALGLDMFAPNHLPLYKQGGIPSKLGLVGAQYYSPFGVANDPLATAESLILPQAEPFLEGLMGKDWLMNTLSSPTDPSGQHEPNVGVRALTVLNSVLGMLLPMYTKAQQVVTGGASQYGTSTLWAPETKGPNPGIVAGLKHAVNPLRVYRDTSGSTGTVSGGFGGLGSGGYGGRGGSLGSGGFSGGGGFGG